MKKRMEKLEREVAKLKTKAVESSHDIHRLEAAIMHLSDINGSDFHEKLITMKEIPMKEIKLTTDGDPDWLEWYKDHPDATLEDIARDIHRGGIWLQQIAQDCKTVTGVNLDICILNTNFDLDDIAIEREDDMTPEQIDLCLWKCTPYPFKQIGCYCKHLTPEQIDRCIDGADKEGCVEIACENKSVSSEQIDRCIEKTNSRGRVRIATECDKVTPEQIDRCIEKAKPKDRKRIASLRTDLTPEQLKACGIKVVKNTLCMRDIMPEAQEQKIKLFTKWAQYHPDATLKDINDAEYPATIYAELARLCTRTIKGADFDYCLKNASEDRLVWIAIDRQEDLTPEQMDYCIENADYNLVHLIAINCNLTPEQMDACIERANTQGKREIAEERHDLTLKQGFACLEIGSWLPDNIEEVRTLVERIARGKGKETL